MRGDEEEDVENMTNGHRRGKDEVVGMNRNGRMDKERAEAEDRVGTRGLGMSKGVILGVSWLSMEEGECGGGKGI